MQLKSMNAETGTWKATVSFTQTQLMLNDVDTLTHMCNVLPQPAEGTVALFFNPYK